MIKDLQKKTVEFIVLLSISLFIFFIRCNVVNAQDYYSDGLVFGKTINASTNETYYTVRAYNGSDTDVIIPDYYQGLPVRAIDQSVFAYKNITSVKLPDTLTEIGARAFQECVMLKKIVLPDSLEKLYYSSPFYKCTGLEEVVFGNNIKSISDQAFFQCTSLKTIYLPDTITTLKMSAFMNCSGLETVIGGKGLTSIESQVFSGCESLKGFVIGENVENIGINAFLNCKKMAFLSFGASVKSISGSAFAGCESLEYIFLNDGLESISGHSFHCCQKIKVVSLPSSLNSISSYAFNECKELSVVYYRGNEQQYENISIDSDHNDALIDANVVYGNDCLHEKTKFYSGSAPTCTLNGYSDGVICTSCAKVLSNMEIKNSLDHDWDEGKVIKEASCKTEGVKVVTCDRCGETEEKSLKKLEHEVRDIKGKEATCMEEGLTLGKICDKCNEIIVKQEIIPRVSHKIVIDTAVGATCANSGLTEGKHCSVCNEVIVKQREVPATGNHIWKKDRVENGNIIYNCIICNQIKAVTIKTTSINVTGISHNIAAGKKINLSVSVLPSTASNKKVIWTTSDKRIATVTQKGVVSVHKNTGKKTVYITATAADKSGAKKSFKITSKKGIVTNVSITGNKTLAVGKTIKLKAKVTATKGANKNLKWMSSNPKYATVTSSGKVKTFKAGKGKNVKITAMATDGSNKKKTVTIKIK